MGDRMLGGVRGARRHVNAGLDTVGGWGQAMDDRLDRFSGDFRRDAGQFGQRMAGGFAELRSGGGGGRRTPGGGHTAGGAWRYA